MRNQAHLPPRTPFGDVVGGVQRGDIDTTAPEVLQSVKRNAMVRMPPALVCPISFICSVTMS